MTETTRFLLDAYLDVNILLACAWLIWLVAQATIAGAGMHRAFEFRLDLLQGTMLALAAAPFLALGLGWILAALMPGASLRIADLAVAQYLDGNVQMNAARLEGLLGLRHRLVDDLVHLNTPLALTLAGAWATGAAVCALRTLARTRRLRRLLSESHLLRRTARHDIRLSDRARVPFSTRTLRRRVIVLPSHLLGRPRHFRIALMHEFQHMRRADVEWELALEVLRPLFFWNPAFHFWKRQTEELRELSCDQRLLAERKVGRRDYLDCLLQVCEDGIAHERRHWLVAPAVPLVAPVRRAFGNQAAALLRHRVLAALEGGGRFARRGWTLAALAVLVLAITFAALAIQRPGDWSQDRLMLSTIVNLERLEARNAALARLANY